MRYERGAARAPAARLAARRANRGGTPTFALWKVPLAGHSFNFSLCLAVARTDTPPLQSAAFVFVSCGSVLVRVFVVIVPARSCTAAQQTAGIVGDIRSKVDKKSLPWKGKGARLLYSRE